MFRKNAVSTLIALGALLAITLGILLLSRPAHAGPFSVEVCHLPPGELDNFHTITVSEKALDAHVAHGDLEGACDGVCAALCDDGDACTVDDSGDCSTNGCPVERPAVNCDDSDPLTNDYCDSGTGCVNTCIDGYVYDPTAQACVLVAPTCPCFDMAALEAIQASIAFCGDVVGTYGVIWDSPDAGNDNGAISACSGPDCRTPNSGFSCGLGNTFGENTDISSAENDACVALLTVVCQPE